MKFGDNGYCACPKVTWIWHPKVTEFYKCPECNEYLNWVGEEE
jgi:hypothetical protein